MSQERFAQAAGVHRSHVIAVLAIKSTKEDFKLEQEARKKAGYKAKSWPTFETLKKLCSVTGDNPHWLEDGMDIVVTMESIRYPNLASVLASKELMEGISEEAIAFVKSRANKEGPQEMSEMDWLLELKKAHKALGSYIASLKIKTREIDPGEFD